MDENPIDIFVCDDGGSIGEQNWLGIRSLPQCLFEILIFEVLDIIPNYRGFTVFFPKPFKPKNCTYPRSI